MSALTFLLTPDLSNALHALLRHSPVNTTLAHTFRRRARRSARYERRQVAMSTNSYQPLLRYLSAQQAANIPTTFAAIERILGRSLPASARNYSAWWAN